MALTQQQLDQAAGIVASASNVRAAAAAIREQLAPMRALVVDAFDMRDETPTMQLDQRSLYLMSTDGHCWSVTPELERASAFVLTQA
jgi:adhesin HecA-like repeat protein